MSMNAQAPEPQGLTRTRRILLIAHLLQPIDRLSIQLFLNSGVCHRRRRCSAMPVLLTRSKPHHVSGPNLLYRTAPALRPPAAAVTISVWPSGCVCHAVRAPGSNVTLALTTRAGSGALNSGSTHTTPVNQSAGPLPEACEPLLLISICHIPFSMRSRQLSRTVSRSVTRRMYLPVSSSA